jgi:cell division septation protein DedD
MAEAETETSLSTGRILILFFGVVVMCALFFVLGYRLGKNSPGAASATGSSEGRPAIASQARPPAPEPSRNGLPSKPGYGLLGSNADCNQNQEVCAATGEGGAAPEPAGTPGATPAGGKGPHTTAEGRMSATTPAPKTEIPPGYIVQVAAVSKQQDAQALLSALRKKQYPVFIATSSADGLFHVQVGPFGESKDAEAARGRLVADGYNPIIKK